MPADAPDMGGYALYGLAWALFGLTHSGLAGRRLAGRWSRLVYNAIAVAQFLALGWVGATLLGERPAFDLPAWTKMVMGGVHVLGWGLMIAAIRRYDLGRLGGLTQLGAPDAADESLHTGGLHAVVRHPVYAAGFLILWGAAVSPLGLATALWASLYLLVGTHFEERRLLGLYGAAYARYRRSVPAFIPVPWRRQPRT